MPSTTAVMRESALEGIQRMLGKIDVLPVPPRVERLLVRQAAKMMDRALPRQRGHGRRTAALARRIASWAGLSPDSLHHLTLAALLHDIGLLALPPALVPDAGCLDVQAYAARQSHPRLGAESLEPYRFLHKASVIIAHHHERWDGSGYPYGIRGTFIPLEARILAIADAVDAIQVPGVSDDVEREKAAYRILIVGAGTQFDPHLVEICAQRPALIFAVN
jgi:HD-GYP domain-containing protein (c-di-GMP phosphodiesterase class II)